MYSNNVFQYSKIRTRKRNAKKSIKTEKKIWNPALLGIRNPVPGIRNPYRGIQNPRLSWIPLHRAISNEKQENWETGKGYGRTSIMTTYPNSESNQSITTPSNKGVVIKLMIICSSYPAPWLSQQDERGLLLPEELPNTSLLPVWFYRFF